MVVICSPGFAAVVNRNETALDSMVIPLCCSSSLLSRYRTFPVGNNHQFRDQKLVEFVGHVEEFCRVCRGSEGTLPASLEDMMLLAARSESVNVVFPWSTCPQAVIFRVVCEFDPIDENEGG